LSGAPSEVKDAARSASRRGFSRHLEGWQAGAVAVAIALVAALLAVPHAIAPEAMPLPHVDWREARRLADLDRARTLRATENRLPFEVRAVGELVREFGTADAAGKAVTAGETLYELRKTVRIAQKKYGAVPLSELRSAQTELFVEALWRWEAGAEETREIAELGGNFLNKARASSWLTGDRELGLGDAERRALFRIRWAELTELRSEPALSPGANDWRIYYRFLLEHPERGARLGPPAEEQLRYVARAEQVDPSYPGAFARGVLYYRLALFAKSADSFRAFLSQGSGGPWRLRARNHLLAALERAGRTGSAE
jgi:hypothetical protein